MKHMLKKAILLGLAALMLSSTVSAAKKKKDDPYKKLEKQKDPKTKKVYDFKGMSIILGDWWSDPNQPPASKMQEDQKAFRDWTMKTYNVQVVQKASAGWASQPQFGANY